MIPIRFLFRSRWAALAWAGCICLSAAHFAEGRGAISNHPAEMIDAAAAPAGLAAAAAALSAEDPD